ncbi:tRNA preQ1(34) S-adenosylmethionine ribosyltransferase-isomerase QueA [Calderihabitans maritimus]|uniref:S-adenosylmethionine:tRNA ribosyltransferase-isomerase n=1 Tax=Calderihabitans maritimus TaxID=1246530 RepID=A0A1Z5HTP6_9FIRM|nr:tRNA preQ1(34) S-adenosylmethionine ribosyltransferase-isomerase QueA [Calderihabitans maritimus]GAW92707.1 S-adenosylmethionine:tRNA-ribosyltransferase-isomerase [Calderihabitans maritimus]
MRVADFDYQLPEELIAQEPVEPRDSSRLMILHRKTGKIEHRIFRDIVEYLRPGDVMVLNNTRVIPARLYGRKAETGAQVEVFLLTHREGDCWETLVRPGKKVKPGNSIIFGNGELVGKVVGYTEAGGRLIQFQYDGSWEAVINRLGRTPLPPYIRTAKEYRERYQTVYALHEGSVAAPTAGLHFTPELLEQIKKRGIKVVFLLLHVGLGTFQPVKTDRVEDHRMHAEYYRLSSDTAETINHARRKGGRVIAVGTTTVRTLETVADEEGNVRSGEGWTDIFIYPGHRFRAVDALVTNFHLPRSTLLMLVSAFAGRDKIMEAYREAIDKNYRFYSFGDAMLIL